MLAFNLLHPFEREFVPENWTSLPKIHKFEEARAKELMETYQQELAKGYEKELVKCGRTVWVDTVVPLKKKLDYLSRLVHTSL